MGDVMGSPLERRQARGRRQSDGRDTRALRGLLHDLGHEMTTLSYLVEAVRGDVSLPDDSSYRLELLSLEMARLLDIIRHGLSGMDTSAAEPVKVREMTIQLARLAQLAYAADVTLRPGPEATSRINPVVLWRVLSNVVDNAARAAGPSGRVVMDIHHNGRTVIDVTDDGPGFGASPPGLASLGLDIVTSLLESAGGSLMIGSPPAAGGTTVTVVLPREIITTSHQHADVAGSMAAQGEPANPRSRR